MWSHHPDNDTPEAWIEMLDGLRKACRIASRYGVQLAIEPETANVVSDAFRAEQALRELGSKGHSVSVILDAANLYQSPVDPRTHPEVIDEVLARLGEPSGSRMPRTSVIRPRAPELTALLTTMLTPRREAAFCLTDITSTLFCIRRPCGREPKQDSDCR